MSLFAFDGASAFDLDAAKRAGAIVCTTYIRGTPGGFNHADPARVAAIRARGMGASPNWEANADYFGTCTTSGALWAGADALAACRALGYPDNGSIACSFSFDFDVPVNRFLEMGQKVKAVTAGLGGHYQTMIYGQQALIDWLVAHHFISGKHWLMMSTFGQTYNPRSASVCMVQGHDLDGNWIMPSPVPGTDINTVTDPAAVRAWWPDNSPYGDIVLPADITAIAKAAAAEVWATAFAHLDETGKPNTRNHAAAVWLTDSAVTGQSAATKADVAAIVGVPLTDAQVQAIAAAVAAKMPGAPAFVVQSTITPKGTP